MGQEASPWAGPAGEKPVQWQLLPSLEPALQGGYFPVETEATAQSEFLLIYPEMPPTPEAGDPYRGQDKLASSTQTGTQSSSLEGEVGCLPRKTPKAPVETPEAV